MLKLLAPGGVKYRVAYTAKKEHFILQQSVKKALGGVSKTVFKFYLTSVTSIFRLWTPACWKMWRV